MFSLDWSNGILSSLVSTEPSSTSNFERSKYFQLKPIENGRNRKFFPHQVHGNNQRRKLPNQVQNAFKRPKSDLWPGGCWPSPEREHRSSAPMVINLSVLFLVKFTFTIFGRVHWGCCYCSVATCANIPRLIDANDNSKMAEWPLARPSAKRESMRNSIIILTIRAKCIHQVSCP